MIDQLDNHQEKGTTAGLNGMQFAMTSSTTAVRQQQLLQMRPTLIVGIGGSGQLILANLKSLLQASFGDSWRRRIRLLAFDTTEETFQMQSENGLVTLEPDAEFFDIGNVPVNSIVRNIDSQAAIKERLGPVLAKLPVGVLRSGSKQLRPFGLMAMLWNHPTVVGQLRQALWMLAGRNQTLEQVTQQQGINVFICCSLVGGTGSGGFLDMAYLIRDSFKDLGSQAEFCHITGIGFLPQAFFGIRGPNLLPNAAASLEELNHLMLKGSFQARYPDGRVLQTRESPFDIFHVLDGVDQSGRTWTDIHAVAAMAAQGIFLQMGTQLGRKGENAFDNLDEILTGRTAGGEGTFLASFGKGELRFDAPRVALLFTDWLLQSLIQSQWLQTAALEPVGQQSTLLETVKADSLRLALQTDPDTAAPLYLDLSQPGWLQRKAAGEVASEATRYLKEYEQARLIETFLPQIGKNGQRLSAQLGQRWQQWFDNLLFQPGVSLRTTEAAVGQLQQELVAQLKGGQLQLAEIEKRQTRLSTAMVQAENALAKAANSFPLGRSGRIREALSYLFRTAQELFETEIGLQTLRTQLTLWQDRQQWLRQQRDLLQTFIERLENSTLQLEADSRQRLLLLGQGGVGSLSLADGPYLQKLYRQWQPEQVVLKELVENPVNFLSLKGTALVDALRVAVGTLFKFVSELTIEDVIQDRRDELSPRARRQQLFQLATPSWNLDRARLPEGGAHLVQLEVLGVPNASRSLFEGESMLVSTHDPYRLTALVVAAGAPPSALQQYDQYKDAQEQLGGRRPLHVLPDFLVTADQGRLLFALGSIFGIIYSQGTFFYYQPSDPLESAFKLANGLSNAIHVFSEQETLVNEVSERVEGQIARLGLREAIAILTDYYSTAPNGNTALDEQLRELKRLVRDYVDGLRRIDAFTVGIHENGRGNL